MTTNIEEQFFKWAGVEPITEKYFNTHLKNGKIINDKKEKLISQGIKFNRGDAVYPKDYEFIRYSYQKYPPITPSIILELEEILLKHTEGFELLINEHHRYAYIATIYSNGEYWRLHSSDEIRHNALLELLIEVNDTNIKLQVEKLFKGGE